MNFPLALRASVVVAVIAAGGLVPATSLAVAPPGSTAGPEVSAAQHSDVSPPIRNLQPTSPSSANMRERPLRLIGQGGASGGADPVVQAGTGAAAATTAGLGFAGVGQGDYGFSDQYSPPDTSGAAGLTQYVQWVNTYFAVFDKATGAIAAGFPKAGNAVWAGFGGGCEVNNDGDPIVQYDKAANRWILTQFSVSTLPYLQCVAVSTTPDATGSYNRYSFSYGTSTFNDYPKLGVWPDGYYVTYNMFTNTFVGARVCALDRTAMLAGAAATQQCFQLSSIYGGLLPSDLDGSIPPPAGSPNLLMNFVSNALNLWRFHVDWGNSANSTLTGPTNIPVAAFARACNGGTCVPQLNTTQKLDSLGDRLMYRLAYRHFADGHEALVVNHSVAVGTGSVSSVRWYELRNAPGSTMASSTPVVYQQGTLGAADGIHRWMGSIAMDGAGNIAVGYSASSSTLNPSIRYTGRAPTDTLGTMQAETIVKAGSGSQLANLSRWGDYSAMTIDPVDDCTFWYTSEYLKTNGTWNWSTWITSFKFPGCGSVPASLTVTTSSLPNGAVGQSYSATLTASGGTGSYSWSLASGSGPLPAGLNLSPSGEVSGTPTTTGTSNFTVQVNDGATSAAKPLSITVNPAPTALTITTTSLPEGKRGAAYPSTTLTATGGTPPYTWALSAGSLPPGLTLGAATGTISGKPTKTGTFVFTVRATDAATPAQTATRQLTIQVTKR